MRKPGYTLWECLIAALALAQRALDEVRVLAQTPAPQGPPGKDGLGFGDLKMDFDGKRTVKLIATNGDQTKHLGTIVFPFQIYRGVYKADTEYEPGDTVTWGGNTWHCNSVTKEKPMDNSVVWTMQTKRGQNGKDGLQGPQGPQGLNGKDGRDLTQLGFDGKKY